MGQRRAPWTIASARQHFPELVRLSASEPQHVYRRNKLVAAVVSPELAEHVDKNRLAEKLAELQRICAEEGYEMTPIVRRDRPNPFAGRKPTPRARSKAIGRRRR